jgi:hypothetical protein
LFILVGLAGCGRAEVNDCPGAGGGCAV